MQTEERRRQIAQLIKESTVAIPGAALAKQFNVSRQIIV